VQVVVVDWVLPSMDGLRLCRQLKSAELPGYRYCIVVTGKVGREGIVRALEAGADDYMVKPLDHDELMARIRAGERIVELERTLAEARSKAREEADRDSLTGLFNRRHFDRRLKAELRRARRGRARVALLMMDLDHFKQVNDLYGHSVGDEVLRQVGRVIASEVRRDVDVPARYGGEEFAVIAPEQKSLPGPTGGPGKEFAVMAPETNLFGARSLGERIRTRVAELRVPAGDQFVSVTLSVGIAVFDPRQPWEGDAACRLVEAADRRLYQAKQSGRNRVAA
jgi:two-component system cell cycle response regulator